jgi:diguanylate cyclase (GGDEF)-like protein
VFDSDLRVVICNERYTGMLGFSSEVIQPGAALPDIIRHGVALGAHPGRTADDLIAERLALFARGVPSSLRFSVGDSIIDTCYKPMPDGSWVALYDDVTEREQRVEALRAQNLQFDAAIENMSHGITMYDAGERLVVANHRYYELVGIDPAIVRRGMTFHEVAAALLESGVYPGTDPDDVYRSRRSRVSSGRENRYVDELRSGRVLASRHQMLPAGGWVSVFEDVTDMRCAEAQIVHMAHHDSLTGLPNRVLFRQRLSEALARARRSERFAVISLDLDHFKDVNDTLGHPVGDGLLREVAARLRRELRETDTAARLGGDEFAILQSALDLPRDAIALAERLIRSLSGCFDIAGHRVVVGASVGIAVAPGDGSDPDTLLKNVDHAEKPRRTLGF